MDERVDQPGPQIEPAPLSRQTQIARRSRLRGVVILLILLSTGAGVGWYLWTRHATQVDPSGGRGRTAQSASQPVGAATIDKGDIRIVLNELGTVTSLD